MGVHPSLVETWSNAQLQPAFCLSIALLRESEVYGTRVEASLLVGKQCALAHASCDDKPCCRRRLDFLPPVHAREIAHPDCHKRGRCGRKVKAQVVVRVGKVCKEAAAAASDAVVVALGR